MAAQIGVVSGHVVIDADRFILSSDSDDDAESNAVPERSDSSATDTATLRSNRQKRWERLNRSLEDDLNRISVVAEDADAEGNGEFEKSLHPCPRDGGNYFSPEVLCPERVSLCYVTTMSYMFTILHYFSV